MKYIISESRLKETIYKFLDQYDWKVWDYSDSEISVYTGFPGRRVFFTKLYNTPPDVPEDEFILKIEIDFYSELEGFFRDHITAWILIEWFNEKFNSNCVTFDWFRLDSDLDIEHDDY